MNDQNETKSLRSKIKNVASVCVIAALATAALTGCVKTTSADDIAEHEAYRESILHSMNVPTFQSGDCRTDTTIWVTLASARDGHYLVKNAIKNAPSIDGELVQAAYAATTALSAANSAARYACDDE